MSQATAIALPLRQQTPEWVDARRDFIGSSDLPILTGNTPYGTSVFSLWAIKTRLAQPEPIDPDTQELFDLGHLLEDDIAERYTAITGREVRVARQMRARKDLPWAAASLDRVSAIRGDRRIVEVKWVPHRHWLTDGPEPVPAYVQDQVQWQLFVTGWDVADVAVLNGSKVHVYEGIGPNERYQADLVYIARWFRDLVERGVPPPVDGSEATRQALSRIHPRQTLDLMPASAETDALAADLREAIKTAKAATADEDRLRNVFRLMLGEHAGVEGDGYRVSWRKNADSTKTAWKLVAAAYRALLEAQIEGAAMERLSEEERLIAHRLDAESIDAIESLHTEVKEGPRVLTPRFRDEEKGTWT